jgi:hypothetical protein
MLLSVPPWRLSARAVRRVHAHMSARRARGRACVCARVSILCVCVHVCTGSSPARLPRATVLSVVNGGGSGVRWAAAPRRAPWRLVAGVKGLRPAPGKARCGTCARSTRRGARSAVVWWVSVARVGPRRAPRTAGRCRCRRRRRALCRELCWHLPRSGGREARGPTRQPAAIEQELRTLIWARTSTSEKLNVSYCRALVRSTV